MKNVTGNLRWFVGGMLTYKIQSDVAHAHSLFLWEVPGWPAHLTSVKLLYKAQCNSFLAPKLYWAHFFKHMFALFEDFILRLNNYFTFSTQGQILAFAKICSFYVFGKYFLWTQFCLGW